MVKVTIYIRNMDRETWIKRLSIMSINDEPADEVIADRISAICQLGATRYKEFAYDEYTPHSDVLTHLEQIANGQAHEQDALLYVNHPHSVISTIALNFVKWGHKAVWWKYEHYESDEDEDD
jgi:hypothetical protein